MSTLTEIRAALEREIGDETKFSFINTRLILTTGVNLRQISASEDGDQARVKRARAALTRMGFLQDRKGVASGP